MGRFPRNYCIVKAPGMDTMLSQHAVKRNLGAEEWKRFESCSMAESPGSDFVPPPGPCAGG